ncbi:hypothetical protein VIGAN_08208700 [Vigna angularis var. angularis]|uniref:Short-chain dehydrogenase TIC 32, chloroplastic n=1 Tax=Vigna angularis var. angularis TaxID=157739 RepID=A0A0S3SRB8_PHAAN|nr:hypothetical protein VIGAN_08208700 [Vigna angularis var. angularis]
MLGIISLVTGRPGPSGFGSASTAEQVTQGIDASNLTAIITGGASGIGLETARVLALRNAHVIIGARNMDSAKEAKQMILGENESARVDILKLDLCSVNSVRTFVNNFIALALPLNILINNAGVMFCPYQKTEDGIEMQFATNHLGHFLLTNLLLGKMKQTAKESGIEGRIINLSSIAHVYTYEEGIRFDNINEEDGYSDKKAYGQSKLANILHAKELSRRLQEEGANMTANAVHPGVIMTPLMRHSSLLMNFLKMFTFFIWKNIPQVYFLFVLLLLARNFNNTNHDFLYFLILSKQGAATTCFVALHPSLKGESGKYFLDCNEYQPSAQASNQLLGRKLWDFSNKFINSLSKA